MEADRDQSLRREGESSVGRHVKTLKHDGSPGHCLACKASTVMEANAPKPRIFTRDMLKAMGKPDLIELVYELGARLDLAAFHSTRAQDLLTKAPRLEP